MVLSLTTILHFYGGLPDSIKEQIGTVSEYYENFMAYAESVNVSDPEILLPCFINGLNIQIHREIFGRKFNTVLDAWFAARMIEIRIEDKHGKEPSTISDPPYQQSSLTIPEKNNQNSDQKQAEADLQEDEEQRLFDTSSGGAPPMEADDDLDGKPKMNCSGAFIAFGRNAISRTASRGSEEVADLSSGSGAEVGASAKGKAVAMSELSNATPLDLERDSNIAPKIEMCKPMLHHCGEEAIRSLCGVPPILAKPPPLIAALFLWNRKDETTTVELGEAVTVEGGANSDLRKAVRTAALFFEHQKGKTMKLTCGPKECPHTMASVVDFIRWSKFEEAGRGMLVLVGGRLEILATLPRVYEKTRSDTLDLSSLTWKNLEQQHTTTAIEKKDALASSLGSSQKLVHYFQLGFAKLMPFY